MRAPRLAALAVLTLSPLPALACEPPDPEVNEDRALVLSADGGFANAAADDYDFGLSGNPVRDLGGGRTGQVVTASVTCYSSQWLLFADCTTGASIAVLGLTPGPAEAQERPFLLNSTLALQRPQGPLALTSATTVAEVLAQAGREGWTVRTDLAGWAAENGPANRWEPMQGCRLFYPGSPGDPRADS